MIMELEVYCLICETKVKVWVYGGIQTEPEMIYHLPNDHACHGLRFNWFRSCDVALSKEALILKRLQHV